MMSMFAWMLFKLHLSVAQMHAPPPPAPPPLGPHAQRGAGRDDLVAP